MDRRMLGPHPFHVVGDKYLRALVEAADAIPVPLPSWSPPLDIAPLLDRLDGLLLTGSPSNIAPERYAGGYSWDGNLLDPERDATTLPLVREAIARRLPLLAICRGLQEVNVALGGSLHPQVHALPGAGGETLDRRGCHGVLLSGTTRTPRRSGHPPPLRPDGEATSMASARRKVTP